MGGYAAAAGLAKWDRVRAVALAVRRDAREVDPDREPAPALVEPVADPFESVDAVHDRLTTLEARLRRRNDRRAVFATVYARMTGAVRDRVDRGRFVDPDWMRAYTVTFANYYRRAFLDFERGHVGTVPEPWRIAFGTAARGRSLVVQDALLGVNAHVNYDLALALDDVGIDPRRERKRRDHRAVNDVLARLVDAQQAALAELYDPGIGTLDASLGRLDETFALFSLTEGREWAWRVAAVLADGGWTAVDRYARWLLRTTATGGALFVLAPTVDTEVVHALARAERDRVDLDATLEHTRRRMDAVETTSG
jgi:hypothetical protein